MQLNIPPDLESLINKRLSTGAYANADEVLRCALEAQDSAEHQFLVSHIEEGYLQAEKGMLVEGDQARQQIQAMKEYWRSSRR